jgi:hypothetical protein
MIAWLVFRVWPSHEDIEINLHVYTYIHTCSDCFDYYLEQWIYFTKEFIFHGPTKKSLSSKRVRKQGHKDWIVIEFRVWVRILWNWVGDPFRVTIFRNQCVGFWRMKMWQGNKLCNKNQYHLMRPLNFIIMAYVRTVMRTAVNVVVSYKVIKEGKTDNWLAGRVPSFMKPGCLFGKMVPVKSNKYEINSV